MSNKWNIYEAAVAFSQAPLYHLVLEGLLVLWLLWLLLRKSYHPQDATGLTEKEKEELVAEWIPEPLVPEYPTNHPALNPRVVTGKAGKFINVDGINCLNVATHNYLGLIENEAVENAAVDCLKKYGVGSCGPRGFFGTVDVHMELEEKVAQFMKLEEAILYSYGFSTVASAIPAYAKKGDIIFVDEGVNFAIQQGLLASRSHICFFKHNDIEHLKELLLWQEAEDRKDLRKARVTRRFLVAEGIYMNSGDLCPLPQLMELKKKFKVRLFLDESISFATLGSTGRGITEHFDIDVNDVDLISGSMENAMSSIGGFCVGSSFVVDHQRLSGLGYAFSASLPPLLAKAAMVALEHVEANPSLVEKLHSNCCRLHEKLSSLPSLHLGGEPISPVKHLYLSHSFENRQKNEEILRRIVDYAQKEGVALVMPSYLESKEHKLPPPSIRITVNALLTEEDMDLVQCIIKKACKEIV